MSEQTEIPQGYKHCDHIICCRRNVKCGAPDPLKSGRRVQASVAIQKGLVCEHCEVAVCHGCRNDHFDENDNCHVQRLEKQLSAKELQAKFPEVKRKGEYKLVVRVLLMRL